MALVVLTPEARDDVDRIDRWWRSNRRAATGLFLDEIEETFALLAASPFLGRRYRSRTVQGTRRVLLRATRYHLYYVPTANGVVVLAVWSAIRGRGPNLAARSTPP